MSLYESGTFDNSHELIHKLIGFLINAGWQKHVALKTSITDSDGFDVVFYSNGEDGYKDIYIRIAAGMGDTRTTTGDIQFPIEDGYNGYINGFAYQYFPPSGTSGADGCNELGYYGPLLYVSSGDDSTLAAYNMFNFTKPNISRYNQIFEGIDISTTWQSSVGGPIGFDGRGILYQTGPSSSGAVNLFDNSFTGKSRAGTTSYLGHYMYARKNNGQETMYAPATSATVGQRISKYIVSTNTWNVGSIGDPPFSFASTTFGYGAQVLGTKRKNISTGGYPQHRLGYWARGYGSSGSTEWAYFDVETESFSPSVISPALPVSSSTTVYPFSMTFAPKESTGYGNDRLYAKFANSTAFRSIAIDDDGYVSGSWTTHSVTPVTVTNGFRIAFIGKSIFMVAGTADSEPQKQLYRWQCPASPTGSGSWELISSDFFITEQDEDGFLFEVHNHLCNRAKINENSTNTYWAFADKDRLVVVVHNGSSYNYIYTGLYDSYLNTSGSTLTQDAMVGNYWISVADTSIFEIGKKYLIIDSTGTNFTIIGEDKSTAKMAPSQIVTIVGKDGEKLMINSLKYDFAAGSRIAEDPLPLMVRVHSLEYAQTLNNISLDRNDCFSDPPFQVYKMRPVVNSTTTQAADINARYDENFIFPIVLYSDGIDEHVGNEIRGQLRGVYASGTGLSSGAEILIGADTYIVFDIQESSETRRIIVGPK